MSAPGKMLQKGRGRRQTLLGNWIAFLLKEGSDPATWLAKVMLGEIEPTPAQLRAAEALLPYSLPRYAVVTFDERPPDQTTQEDALDRLDRADRDDSAIEDAEIIEEDGEDYG